MSSTSKKLPAMGMPVVDPTTGTMNPVWYQFFLTFSNAAITGSGGAGILASDGTLFFNRTLIGTANQITITNSTGASGNPTVSISNTYAGQTSITTVGTISSGTWAGTAIANSHLANGAVANLSGTNTGDQTITLTGNVTGSGTGNFATTIAAGVVTNAMLAGSIANSKLANGAVANLSGTNTGDQTNISGNAATVTTNANLTGPVTSTGNATAIANGAITNAMLANGAVANLSGTNTGDQTISDATITTTDITTNNASTTKHGFLKKLDNTATHYMDGTGAWSTPAGSGGSGTVTSVTYTGDGVVQSSTPTSAVTTTGTLTATLNTQTTKTFLAGPTSGSAATPTFRTIAVADVPTLNQNTSGSAASLSATLAVASGGTGVTAIPSFSAYDSAGTTITHGNIYTKVNLATEVYDTNSNFASSRFTPTVAGKYLICFQAALNSANVTTTNQYFAAIYLNGSLYSIGCEGAALATFVCNGGSNIVNMNGSTDYIEMYVYNGNVATDVATLVGQPYTFMSGVRVA